MKLLKKQGVAWIITLVMIVAAIGIGRAKAPTSKVPVMPDPGYDQPGAVEVESFYVFDDANVLSESTEKKLSERNMDIYTDMDVLIAVVTCNYGGDLFDYALDYAESIGLGGYDFIVVLDISGDNYWLVQGADLMDWFSDDQCGEYARTYMEKAFSRGDYDSAVLDLTKALEKWYYDNY